ncbi:DUF5666 domain-containing protein [Nocardia sp. NPDC006630]|uniref:DUF5666 domain-containing protein n=1 Tax=Nocardia sp. NPDC006630 TaxID=3157181 RepID=UPI00339EA9F3
MTSPSDPWSRRPEPEPVDGPTEKVGSGAGQAGQPSEVSPTEYFAQQQGPEATRVLPPHDPQWGGYESGGEYPPTAAYPPVSGYGPTPGNPGGMSYGPTAQYAAPGYPGGPGGPGGGYQPAGFPQQPGPPPPPSRTNLWIGLGIAAFALVALVGVVVGVLLAHKDSSDSAASATTTRTTGFAIPGFPGNTSAQSPPSGVPTIPGLGDIDQLGANMGTIASNDGTTLTMTSLSGTTVTVHTDERTQVISLSSTKVADLPVGEMVMVQGDKNADGSVQAKIIISTSLPGGPR